MNTPNNRRRRESVEKIDQVLNNVWIPDGFKDIPADRMGPRMRLKAALDEIFAEPCPNVIDCVESKVFGIGLESMTVGSNEFYTAYAAQHPGVYNLLDAGHYHPTEFISDKIDLHRAAARRSRLEVLRKTLQNDVAHAVHRVFVAETLVVGLARTVVRHAQRARQEQHAQRHEADAAAQRARE